MEHCIREKADLEQLRKCKEDLSLVQNELKLVARKMNLAGNEMRLQILYLLLNEKRMCPCDLSDVLGISVPAVSQHLRKLKDTELVINEKIGQTVFYSLHSLNSRFILPLLEFSSQPVV